MSWEKKFGQFGDVMSVGGLISGGVASYFQGKFRKNQLKSQALQFKHQQYMAKINAKSIESQAQHISKQYNKQAQLKSLAQGIRKGQDARNRMQGKGNERI